VGLTATGVENYPPAWPAAKRGETPPGMPDELTSPMTGCWWVTKKPRHLVPSLHAMYNGARPAKKVLIRPGSAAQRPPTNRPLKGRDLGKSPPDDLSSRPPRTWGAGAECWPGGPGSDPSTGVLDPVCGGAPQWRARSTTCSGRSGSGPSARERCLNHHLTSGWRGSHRLPGENGVRVRILHSEIHSIDADEISFRISAMPL